VETLTCKPRRFATAMVTVASLVMALTATPVAQSDDKIVKIDAGMIEGAVSDEVLSFKGIPHAAPPVGALRWRAPQPVRPGAVCVRPLTTATIATQMTPARVALPLRLCRRIATPESDRRGAFYRNTVPLRHAGRALRRGRNIERPRDGGYFQGYIAAFAKTGDPNRSGMPSWPRHDAAKSELMMFTPDATAIVQADPWKSRLDLIERAVEAQAAAVPPFYPIYREHIPVPAGLAPHLPDVHVRRPLRALSRTTSAGSISSPEFFMTENLSINAHT